MGRGPSFERFMAPGAVPDEYVIDELVKGDVPPDEIDRIMQLSGMAQTDYIESLGATTTGQVEPTQPALDS